jgi:hypothetical protein
MIHMMGSPPHTVLPLVPPAAALAICEAPVDTTQQSAANNDSGEAKALLFVFVPRLASCEL